MALNIDLGSILKESANTADALSQTADQITAITSAGTEINQRRQQLASDAANAAQVKVTTELGDVARQEAARKAVALRLGMDPSIPGYAITQAGDQIKEADAGLADAAEQIRQKKSVNFLENPLGWIAARMTINSDIANYNFYADQKNRAEDTAKQFADLSKEANQNIAALTSTATDTYIGAMKVLGAYQYNAQALDSAAQGARWNMEGIVAASNATRDRLNVLYSANTAVMHEKQYQVELQRLQLSKAEFNLRQEAFNEKKDEDSLIAQYIRDGYFNFTGKQMDPVSTKNAVMLYKAKQPDVVAFFDSGLASSKITGGDGSKPVISLSPYDASTYVAQGKVTNMSPAMNQVGEHLVTLRRQFESPSVAAQYPYDPKDKKSKEVAFNKYVEDQRKLTLSSVKPDSIFAPYPIDKAAESNPNLKVLPVWKDVLAPAAKTGVDINDPNTAFGIVASALKQKRISYNDAVDLSLLYAGGLDMNNQTRNFLAFGMGPVRTYNSPISVPGTMGKTTVNLVDQKQLATAINRAASFGALRGYHPSGDMPAFGGDATDITQLPWGATATSSMGKSYNKGQ